jgi:YqaJ-like viral recombinase domain
MTKAEQRAAKPIPPDDVEVFALEQGSAEWFEARIGLMTASNFASIKASGKDGGESKTRAKLMRRLAGEILTGEPGETYKNSYMDRGNAMEGTAREHYAFTHGVEIERVGFVRRTIPRPGMPPLVVGCSPDSFVGEDRVIEIKTMMPELLIELAERGIPPTEHRAQCQGSLWVTGRSVCDLMFFYRGMPIAPTFSFERDETYIKELRDACEVFDYELRKLIARIKAMGGIK